MKRKAGYLIITLGCVAIAALWYIPAHSWRARLIDGASGGGFGPNGRGVAFSTATWGSLSGMTVEEIVTHYSSASDAHSDFEAELKNGGTVIQRSDDTTADYQRAVKVYGSNNQGASEIITLAGQQIRFVKAGALKYALTFEKSWLKF